MGFYGSREWSETVIEIAEKELFNENRVVFSRIQEIRLWIRKLRRFGYPKKATYLNDKLYSMLRAGGLPFTPSPFIDSSEVPYQQGLCNLYSERVFTECPFPVRLTMFSSCHVCLTDLEQTRDQLYGKLKASTNYLPLSFCYHCHKTFDDKELLDINRPFRNFSFVLSREILNYMYCPLCGHPHQLYRKASACDGDRILLDAEEIIELIIEFCYDYNPPYNRMHAHYVFQTELTNLLQQNGYRVIEEYKIVFNNVKANGEIVRRRGYIDFYVIFNQKKIAIEFDNGNRLKLKSISKLLQSEADVLIGIVRGNSRYNVRFTNRRRIIDVMNRLQILRKPILLIINSSESANWI